MRWRILAPRVGMDRESVYAIMPGHVLTRRRLSRGYPPILLLRRLGLIVFVVPLHCLSVHGQEEVLREGAALPCPGEAVLVPRAHAEQGERLVVDGRERRTRERFHGRYGWTTWNDFILGVDTNTLTLSYESTTVLLACALLCEIYIYGCFRLTL